MPTPELLPIAGPPARVRRDAAANSDRILCAAREMIVREGAAALTMDRLAAGAGVGKGTVFRAFGNRAGLLAALTDETEREFQRAFLTGPPPLGPGASPLERLLAYGEGRLRLQVVHAEIFRAMASGPMHKFEVPARSLAAAHVRMLLRQCGIDRDLDVLAEALLGPLDSDVAFHLRSDRGLTEEQLLGGWRALVRRVVGVAA